MAGFLNAVKALFEKIPYVVVDDDDGELHRVDGSGCKVKLI
jgi:hypothetical protein